MRTRNKFFVSIHSPRLRRLRFFIHYNFSLELFLFRFVGALSNLCVYAQAQVHARNRQKSHVSTLTVRARERDKRHTHSAAEKCVTVFFSSTCFFFASFLRTGVVVAAPCIVPGTRRRLVEVFEPNVFHYFFL